MIHNKEAIDWKEIKSIIYDHVDIPSAFNSALGFFHPTRRFKNPFRLDKHADCNFFKDKADSRIWLFHDFATGETYDIFRAYEVSQGKDFVEVVEILANLGNCMGKMNEKGLFIDSKPYLEESDISSKDLLKRLKEQKKKEKKMLDGIVTAEYEAKKAALLEAQKKEDWSLEKPVLQFDEMLDFEQHHMDFWAKRGLGAEDIYRHVKALNKVFTDKKTVFLDTVEQPLFLYHDKDKPMQVYRPYSESKAHKFKNIASPDILIKNCDKDSLKKWIKDMQSTESSILPRYPWKGFIVTKGFKDALLIKKLLKDFIIGGKCGEGTKLSKEYMTQIDIEFGIIPIYPIYIWMDNDAAGRKAANSQERHFRSLGYTNVYKVFMDDNNIGFKDIDDFVVATIQNYGEDWEMMKTILEARIKLAENDKA